MISMLHIIAGLIGIVAILLAILVAYRVAAGYASHPTGTFWERLRAGARDSATKLGADFVVIGSGLLSVLIYVPDIVGLPEFSVAVRKMFPPEVVPVIMLGIAVLTHLTRNRSLR